MTDRSVKPEIDYEIEIEDTDTFRVEVENRLSRLIENHNDLLKATIRVSQPGEGHRPLRYQVALTAEVGSQVFNKSGVHADIFEALDQAFYALEEAVSEHRDIFHRHTDTVPRETMEVIVDQEGEVVPDVDTGLVLEEQEVARDLLETITQENKMPRHLQVPREKTEGEGSDQGTDRQEGDQALL